MLAERSHSVRNSRRPKNTVVRIKNRLTPSGFGCLALVALAYAGTTLSSQATTRYWNGNVSQDWAEPNNFQSDGANLPGVPESGDNVYLEAWGTREPLLTNNNYAVLSQVFASKNMTVAAGGELYAAYSVKIGWNGSATLNVAGTLSADNHLDVGGYNGGTAAMNVSGGAISVGGLYLNLNGASTGASYLNLTGGTVTEYGPLSINTTHPCTLNLAGGTLILPDSNLGNVNYWINNSHSIVAYNGGGTVNVDTTTSPGNIILTGVPGAPITTRYWNGNVSQDWTNPNNFQSDGSNLPGVPETGNTVQLLSWGVREPLINNSGNAAINDIHVSKNMTIANGGVLDTTIFKLGESASATLTVSGGSLSAANHLDVGGYNGGTAIMNFLGGSVSVGGLYFNLNGNTNYTMGGSQLNLTGGTLTGSGGLSINEGHPCLLNIAGGTLVLPNTQLANFNFWAGDGSITAYGMVGTTNSFHIDQTTIPGSLVITAINPGFVEDTFTQWNPEVFTNLTTSLDQSMALVPPGLALPTNANYSFGSAISTNGDVYFTEFGSQRVSKYSPASGAVTTVVSSRPGVYGIAADNAGNIFYAQDSDVGAGRVVRRTPGGSETTIISNLTRPRQLTTDTAGNLYVVLEQGKILKWTKGTGVTSTLLDRGQMPVVPQGVAVAPDGRIYFCTYATGGGTGTQLTEGTVWARETNGVIRVIAGGFSRGRGMALHPNGDVYMATEANVWDNGNSGLLVKIATNGAVTRVVSGVDYPQFPSVGADGKVYFTMARDGKLACYNPQNSFALQSVTTPGVTLTAEGATWQQTAGANYPFQLHLTNTNNPSDTMTIAGYLHANPGAGSASMWWNVPVTNLHISLAQVPNGSGNTNSGMFQLPAATVTWAYGAANVSVIPLRKHQRCRWPMTNPGNGALESPAPDFGEQPVSYLVYVNVPTPPALKIQLWTGNQVRISWPTSAAGFSLLRSSNAGSGYTNPGLTVTVEGSENAAYDSRGAGARFYRLTK